MVTAVRLSERIDSVNDEFTNRVKAWLLDRLPELSSDVLQWLVKEHYQFSSANVELLGLARDATAKLADQGVTVELQRNIGEESGHAVMYRRAMGEVGTDVDDHVEFPPTTAFFGQLRELSTQNASCSLGTFYATETAAIFEHQVFYEISRELCERQGIAYPGSRIKKFHDIHLDEGVEQGHKDGLAAFVDVAVPAPDAAGLDSARGRTRCLCRHRGHGELVGRAARRGRAQVTATRDVLTPPGQPDRPVEILDLAAESAARCGSPADLCDDVARPGLMEADQP